MVEPRRTADVVVIGAGPAGIAAATAAAEQGRNVVVLDEGIRAGGQIWRHRDRNSLANAARLRMERLEASGAHIFYGASVVDLKSDLRALVEVDRLPMQITATRAVILCTGARERFLPFPGWTLPGCVGVGGAQALLKAGMRVDGLRTIVAGSGPLLLPVAAALAKAGARVSLVAEQAPLSRVARFASGLWRTPARITDAVRYRSAFITTPFRPGTWVTAAEGSARVQAARVINAAGDERRLECELLCVGYGLIPATELPRLVGCRINAGKVEVDEVQKTSVAGIYCAGEPTGIGGVDAALIEGEIAGLSAAGADVSASLRRRRNHQRAFATRLDAAFRLREELKSLALPDTFVCRCEDVTRATVEQCGSIREARLHARVGMGPCQGRVCGGAVEFLYGWTDDSLRPPVEPVLVSTLAHARD